MHHQVPTCLLQLPQCALKFSVAVALVLVPLVDFVRQTVPVMRTAIEGEIAVKIMGSMLIHNIYVHVHPGTAGTVIISLERTSYTVDEASGFVEVCVILEGLGVEEGDITVDLVTESSTATGKPNPTAIEIGE